MKIFHINCFSLIIITCILIFNYSITVNANVLTVEISDHKTVWKYEGGTFSEQSSFIIYKQLKDHKFNSIAEDFLREEFSKIKKMPSGREKFTDLLRLSLKTKFTSHEITKMVLCSYETIQLPAKEEKVALFEYLLHAGEYQLSSKYQINCCDYNHQHWALSYFAFLDDNNFKGAYLWAQNCSDRRITSFLHQLFAGLLYLWSLIIYDNSILMQLIPLLISYCIFYVLCLKITRKPFLISPCAVMVTVLLEYIAFDKLHYFFNTNITPLLFLAQLLLLFLMSVIFCIQCYKNKWKTNSSLETNAV